MEHLLCASIGICVATVIISRYGSITSLVVPRLGEILGSQIHEGLMGFGNDQALAVLDRHAEHRDDTLRSSLRLKTVKQMMQILGEHEEEEEDERRN